MSSKPAPDLTVWNRVFAEAEAREPRYALTWLAGKLGYELQRVQNWSVRGVPPREYPHVAEVFGESVDWVVGMAPKRAMAPASDRDRLSAEAVRIAAYIDSAPRTEQEILARMIPIDIDLSKLGPRTAPDVPFIGGQDTGFGVDELGDEENQ